MSRKNNKKIKKRYNEFLKRDEGEHAQKQERKKQKKETKAALKEAEQLLGGIGIHDKDRESDSEMDVESDEQAGPRRKIKKMAHKSSIREKKKQERRMKRRGLLVKKKRTAIDVE